MSNVFGHEFFKFDFECPPCVCSCAIPNIFFGTGQNIFCKTR